MDENRYANPRKSGFFFVIPLLAFCLFAMSPNFGAAQILDSIRSSARAASSSPEPAKLKRNDRHEHDHHHHDHDDDDSNFVGDLIGAIFFGSSNSQSSGSSISFASQNSSSQSDIHDSGNEPDINYELFAQPDPEPGFSFAKFPYQSGHGVLIPMAGSKSSQGKLSFWYATDFDNIDSWNSQFRIDNSGAIGLDAQWAHLREKRTALSTDSLNLFDINLTVPWIKSENLIVRAGAGINLLSDRFGTEADYNLTMSADFFPSKPVVIGFEVDHGEVGSTHQTHLLSTAGINWRHVEFMTGYEYRKIGRAEIKGALLGMRIWW